MEAFQEIILNEFRTMRAQISEVNERVKLVNDRVQSLEEKFDSLEEKFDKYEKKFANYEPSFEKAGLTYELVVRGEIQKKKGSDFARDL